MTRHSPRSLGGLLLAVALVILAGTPAAAQTFSSGSTGADGPFNPTCTPTPCTVTVPLPPSGVFNATTVVIPQGVTVKFTRNAANTPVILLATGAVDIGGTIDVSGTAASPWGRPGTGGPGGFDGGVGADGVTTTRGGNGLGPGGGGAGGEGGGGGFGTAGGAGSGGPGGSGGASGPTYGSPALRPILGGSGGGGGGANLGGGTGGGGGGGGGALLIASSTNITFYYGAIIRANGGNGGPGCGGACAAGGGGSGGAIRLVAPTVGGDGTAQLYAQGAASYRGGQGRIRLEATTLTFTGGTTPLATAALPQPVFPPAGQPSLAITSVGGIAAPASPTGSLLAAPDIVLPTGTTNPVPVALTASHIPLGTAILVTATPQSGTLTTATSTGLTGTTESSTATASLTLSLTQTSVLTATATFPLVASLGSGPLYVEGEEVTHIRVAAVFGGHTQVSYLTKSGREIALP